MQLREIHIDGFGIFANKRITGLAPGINIIYGKNEFGKTTLLEFIRRILFGFPTKRDNTNLYTPAQGGSLGGSLKVALQNGEDMVISRSPGTHGGTVRISTSDEVLQGQPALNHLLGNASKDIYRNIYAFTLDELHDFNTLNSDEVKNRIYGAGLGLGNVSLKEIEKEIEVYCTQIFRPRGSSQMGDLLEKIKVNEQDILSIQKNLTLYDELQEKLGQMLNHKLSVQNSLEDMESGKRTLETQIRLYEDTIQLLEGQNKLATLEDLSQFPENGLKTFESMKQEKKNLLLRIEEEQSALQVLKNNRDVLTVNHDLLDHEENVHRLQQSTQSVLSALQDIDRVQFEREDLDMHIAEEIKSIDRDWNQEIVMAFDLTEAEKGQIDSFYDSFESLRKDGDLYQDRLESHRKLKAEKMSEGWNIPDWLKMFYYGFTATGVVGLILGGYFMNIPLLTVALLLIAGGIFLFKMTVKGKNDFTKEDLTEMNLARQWEQNKNELNDKFDEWRQWLKARNLDPSIAPITTKNIAKTARQIKTMIAQRTRLDERILQMQTLCNETRECVRVLEPLVKNVSLKFDLPLNIELICQAFDESKAHREKSNLLENQYQNQADKLAHLENQLENISKDLTQFIRSSGAEDSMDFLRKQSILDNQNSLEEKVAQKRGIIQSNIGLGAYFDNFIEAIQTTPLEEIKQKLSHLQTGLEELHVNREQLLQDIGETLNEIEKLSSNNDLLAKQTELESLKQQLQSLAREWAAYKGALVLLDAAKQEYEKTRQPGVIRSAENLFTQITGGNYRRIIKTIDQDEVLIENDHHQRKGVLEMSRGTREQLYLAMRLGLIDEYETRSEPLPAVMDDVFVNFDDERDEHVIEILNQFGKQRQVLVLTCHQRSLEAYKDIGATAITV
ncbi:MAG: AAA family ATPase [Nitrospinae bacterium]|nr:AAA family ATPase [Nitrospinota bacterium]MBL7021514.1 AAA family ATPase [Nitrospinaceae bacterium]